MTSTRSLVWIVLAVVGCASSSTPTGSAIPESKMGTAALEQLRSREGELVLAREIKASDGWFIARVPAPAVRSSVAPENDQYLIELKIGAEQPVHCLVSRKPGDPPVHLQRVSAGMLDRIAEAIGPIASKQVERIDAGSIGRAPYMGVEWSFWVNSPEGRAPGSVHLLYALKDGAGLTCYKGEIGYTQTFVRLFEEFVKSFEVAEVLPQPTFLAISRISVNGQTAGLNVATVRVDDDGLRKSEVTLHLVESSRADSLNATSVYEYELAKSSDMSLIEQGRVRVANGDRALDLAIRRSDDGKRWVVKGTRRGHPIDADLADEAGPTTRLASLNALRVALVSDDSVNQVLTRRYWSPDEPTRVEDVHLRIVELLDDDRARVAETFEGGKSEAIVERASGHTISSIREIGGMKVTSQQIFVAGID